MEKTLRILVVDDNPDDRVLIKRELSREFPDLQVTEAADAQNLALALAGERFHLVITDYQLGWSNGLAILREIKARWPTCPVIMFTGTGNEEIAVEAMKHGLEDYVIKTPRHYIRLLASVNKALKRTKEHLALQAAEDRYSRLFDNAPIGLYRMTPQGEIVETNPALISLLGYPDRETLLAAKTVEFYVDPADKERWQNQMQHQGEVRGFDLQLRKRDGSAIWVRSNGQALRDEQGHIWCYEGSLEDITREKLAELNLEHQYRFLQTLMDSIPAPVFYKDAQGIYLGCNRVFEQYFGITQKQIVGKTVYDCSLRDLADDYRKKDEELFRHPGTQIYEGQVELSDRTRRTVVYHEAAFKGTDGTLGGLIGVVLDITERKQAEAALIKSEATLRAILKGSPIGIGLANNRVFQWVNDRLSEITGYSREEFIGQSSMMVYPGAAEFERAADIYAQIMKNGWGEMDIQWQHKDGHLIDIYLSSRALNSADLSAGVIFTVMDITARKRAEEAFKVLVNSAPMGIFIVQNDNLKMVNPGFIKICGYSENELIGRRSLDLVAPDYREEVRHNVARMLKGQSHLPFEFPLITKSGETRWVVEKVAPTVYQGQWAVLGYFLDISEHKSLESRFLQAQKMEAVGRLAGGVAHDFNNMLGVIIGHAEMAMMQGSVSAPLQNNLQEIGKAAQRSADLTRQLLAFARQQAVQLQVLNLNDTLSGMLKMLQRLIGEDIDLVWAPCHDPWQVRIDPSQIHQIIANLAVNARDAITAVGKLTIETNNEVIDEDYCTNHPEFVSGEYVSLAVSDDGCGMDKETLVQIFEPFFTTKGVGEGTGLGLATVYGIVKQNDGFINVYSEPGLGTTFKIYLPRCQAESALDQAETEVQHLPGGSETVLIVEDEEAILDIGRAILEQLGYTVLTAGTPGEAIRLAGEYPGDIKLLISDVVMPEMNGRELAERLIAMKPALKCLYMSGYTTHIIAHRGVLDEGVNFIHKPFSMKDLAGKVREVLEG